MKKLKQMLTLLLTVLTVMTTTVFASEEPQPVNFSYSISSATFMSQDLVRLSINFYGEVGTVGNLDTECYVAVYAGESNQLVDVFYLPIHLENPFIEHDWYWYTPEVRITNPSIQYYRFKLIMIDNLDTLSPEGTIRRAVGETNEIIRSNMDYFKFVQFDGIIPYVPIHNVETTVSTKVMNNVLLFEGATDAGYTEDHFVMGQNITVTKNKWDELYKVQGLYCRIMINILNDGTYELRWAEPIENYNKTISIKPENLASKDNGEGEVLYYSSQTDTSLSMLPLADSVAVYRNYEPSSYSEIIEGYDDQIKEYRYVDTDLDNLYDTVYIDYEKIFMVRTVNYSTRKIYVDTEAMRTYERTSLQLDPDDSYTIYDMNIDFDEITAGQIIRIKPSIDDEYTYYDITVENPEFISGEINTVYTDISGMAKYEINGKEYSTLTIPNHAFRSGDVVNAYVFDDTVISMEHAFIANVGVILDAKINNDSSCQITLYTTEGETIQYPLAETINNSSQSWTTDTELKSALPTGFIICYLLNDQNEIFAYDIQDDYYNRNVLKNNEKIASQNGIYNQSARKIGNYYLTDDTIFFGMSDFVENNEEITLLTEDQLVDEAEYEFGVLFDNQKNIIAVVVYSMIKVEDSFESDYIPLLIVKKETVTLEGKDRIKFTGYINGEEVSCLLAEDASDEAKKLNAGDIALYSINNNSIFPGGEITDAKRLVYKSGSELIVADNSRAVIEATGKTNTIYNTDDVAYDEITLNTSSFTELNIEADWDTNRAMSIAQGRMAKAASAGSIKGYGAVGVAYRVQGSLLRLLNVDNYETTFTATGREYDLLKDGDEKLITDVTVNVNEIAYYYNAQTGKYKVSSIMDAETDYITSDYRNAGQLTNDDFVYVYCYDGDTKLIVVVDVNGDNY